MRSIFCGIVVLATISLSTRPVNAIPILFDFTVSSESDVSLFIAAIGGAVTASIPFDVSGSFDATIDLDFVGFPNVEANNFSIVDSQIDLSEEPVLLDLGFLGGVSGSLTGLGINQFFTNQPLPLTETAPDEYSFDTGAGNPTEIAIDEGLFTYLGTGPLGGALGSGTIDFSIDPVSATLGSVGQTGVLVVDEVSPGGFYPYIEVIVTIPITFSDTILTDPIDVDIDLSGYLVATGFIVPEPSTFVLLGIALVALIPLQRRFIGS